MKGIVWTIGPNYLIQCQVEAKSVGPVRSNN